MERETAMQQDHLVLDYPPHSLFIDREYLHIVDATLLTVFGHMGELMRDLTPHQPHSVQMQSYPVEELRRSRLGQALLTIADYTACGMVAPAKVERALKQAQRILFGNGLSEEVTPPPQFHKTDLGRLFHKAYSRLYKEELLTAKEAYDLLGVSRQTLYNRLYKGQLTPIYWHGDENDLRFLRGEIEAWKSKREKGEKHL